MSDQTLWAPWRMSYIKQPKPEQTPKNGCFICDYLSQPTENDAKNLIIERGQHALIVLNRYPYNNGHLLVAPLTHKSDLAELSQEEHLECMNLLSRMTQKIKESMNPDGFNIGLNLGRVAGAGLPGHLHWHLVPRWSGDTNFMPVISDTKVIPQSLESLYQLLRDSLLNDGENET